MLHSEATVAEIVEAVANGVTVKDIQKELGFSTTTQSRRWKALGFYFLQSPRGYYYNGEPELEEEILSLTFKHLFDGTLEATQESITLPSGRIANGFIDDNNEPTTTVEKQDTKPSTPIQTPVKEHSEPVEVKPEPKQEATIFNKLDSIFNESKSEPKKGYHGIYLDADVSAVLDSVPKGNKSKLVNETLRIVFTEQGYLK